MGQQCASPDARWKSRIKWFSQKITATYLLRWHPVIREIAMNPIHIYIYIYIYIRERVGDSPFSEIEGKEKKKVKITG